MTEEYDYWVGLPGPGLPGPGLPAQVTPAERSTLVTTRGHTEPDTDADEYDDQAPTALTTAVLKAVFVAGTAIGFAAAVGVNAFARLTRRKG